ncbi:MAG: hypothetical protein EOP08_14045, partial [Proteobacteria bacterium]
MHRSAALMTALALVALGCDDKKASSSSGAPAQGAQEAVVTPPAASAVVDAGRPARDPRPQGPSAVLFNAARGADLKPEQKEKVAAAEKTAAGDQEPAQHEATKEATKNLYTELSNELKTGKVDAAKVTPLYAPIEAATKGRLEAEAEGLNQLHAALEPEQRKALVADLRKKDAQREEHMLGPSVDGGPPKLSNRSDPHHIERLSKELELDEEQKAKVGAFALKDDGKEAPAATKKKKATELLYAAFEKDTFDAKKIELFSVKTLTESFD